VVLPKPQCRWKNIPWCDGFALLPATFLEHHGHSTSYTPTYRWHRARGAVDKPYSTSRHALHSTTVVHSCALTASISCGPQNNVPLP